MKTALIALLAIALVFAALALLVRYLNRNAERSEIQSQDDEDYNWIDTTRPSSLEHPARFRKDGVL